MLKSASFASGKPRMPNEKKLSHPEPVMWHKENLNESLKATIRVGSGDWLGISDNDIQINESRLTMARGG